jgi:stress response protein YsnF
VQSHDEEHVPVLEASLWSGAHTIAEEVLRLSGEAASIGKRQVAAGRVRMRTITDTIEEFAHVEVRRETVEVTHVPIDRVGETTPEIRTEADLTIVPVLEEVLVVERRLMLKEELHIRRHVETKAGNAPVTLRKQRGVVDRVDPNDPLSKW